MQPFDFQPRTRFVFAPDALDRLGALAAELDARRVLVVTDPGIVAAGHVARAVESLRRQGLAVSVFDQVVENPTTETVDRCLVHAWSFAPDLLVGLGGGSSMDCAKGVNFLYTQGGRMQDYWGVGKARRPMLPMIAVPTTAGTGSEAQSFALISDAETHVKMACGDPKAACRVAVLDPKLTVTQPRQVTALTGMDAISHALETAVTTRRNAVSETFSRRAWQLLVPHFPRVLRDPEDLTARAAMQLGACLAGLAIENSMLGAAHALANPLTQHFGIVHGQAVGVMLPVVVRYNAQEPSVAAVYRQLLDSLPEHSVHTARGEGPGQRLAALLQGLLQEAELAGRLQTLGVPQEELPRLARDAAEQWTGRFNPRPVNAEVLESLYRQAW